MAEIREFKGNDFDAAVAAGTVLVDFWAPWCSHCRVLSKVIEQAVPAAPEAAVVLTVNIDDYPEIATRFNVTMIPTLVLYKNGEIISQCGPVPKAKILEMLAD